MSRLNLVDEGMGLTLDELIPMYASNKMQQDEFKKICETQNSQIKRLMEEQDVTESVAGDYVAKYTVQHRETINEDKMLEIVKHSVYTTNDGYTVLLSDPTLGIIKTKEYIDMDALEDAIYKGLIPQHTLLKFAECKEVKEVVTLKVSKSKTKKEVNE